jgi:hypothetical protein
MFPGYSTAFWPERRGNSVRKLLLDIFDLGLWFVPRIAVAKSFEDCLAIGLRAYSRR